MELSTGLVLKVLGGLGVATVGSVGIYYTNDYFQSALTRFDKGLLEYLDTEGNDIVFSVKQNSTELSSFPTNFTDNPMQITVEVSASTTSTENLKGGDNNSKTKLQSLNGGKNNTGGTAWTWICEMKFEKLTDSNGVNDMDENSKNRVYKSENEGLFGKLKKDVSSSQTEEKREIKDIKRDFIKKCALARTRSKNKEIEKLVNLSSNEIKTPFGEITFKLQKGTSNGNESKLFFVDKDKFNYWFPEEPKTISTSGNTAT